MLWFYLLIIWTDLIERLYWFISIFHVFYMFLRLYSQFRIFEIIEICVLIWFNTSTSLIHHFKTCFTCFQWIHFQVFRVFSSFHFIFFFSTLSFNHLNTYFSGFITNNNYFRKCLAYILLLVAVSLSIRVGSFIFCFYTKLSINKLRNKKSRTIYKFFRVESSI